MRDPQTAGTERAVSYTDFDPDRVAMQDATAQMALLQFMMCGRSQTAVPTTVQTPEVPQAFSTGIIDAMLTSPATGVDSQAWDYVKYYYDAQVFIPQSFVIINKRAFQRLPENVQKAVLEAGERAEQRGWAMSREQTSKLTQTMADKGMVVGQLSEKLAGELHAIGQTMTEEWLKKAGADGQKLLDTYRQP